MPECDATFCRNDRTSARASECAILSWKFFSSPPIAPNGGAEPRSHCRSMIWRATRQLEPSQGASGARRHSVLSAYGTRAFLCDLDDLCYRWNTCAVQEEQHVMTRRR